MPSTRAINVFIASPGDLAVERRAFKEVIDGLNAGFGDGAGLKFVALGWEDTLATTGRRSQAVINLEVDRADVFILAMHRRWGRTAPDSPYSSYTEEEFHRAYDRWKKEPPAGQERRPEIFVFFKYIDPGLMADPGPQLQTVLEFRKSLEESRQVFYHLFKDEAGFKAEVDRHLRAFAKGELPKADAPRDKVLLPLQALEEVKKARSEAERAAKKADQEHKQAEAANALADQLALELAEHAARAALDGRVEEARQSLAKAHQGTTNLRVLHLAFQFYERVGDLAAAEDMLERWLAISGRDAETADTADALANLGSIFQTRGDWHRAEELHKKALAIDTKLGRQEGLANQYRNLGLIHWERNELDEAEDMHKKSLAIEEKLGRQAGMAKQYGNLGLIFHKRDDLDRAEEMYKKSLAIEERLGRQEGMASDYCNLGVIYAARRELGQAEEMHKKSLAIEQKLGHQEGMARSYGSLGYICKERGDGAGARTHWTCARDLFAKIGIPHLVQQIQAWLDALPKQELPH